MAPAGGLDTRTANTPIEYRTTFGNNLSVPVTVHMRNGLKFVVPPDPTMEHNTFVVRVHIRITPQAFQNVVRALHELSHHDSKHVEVLTRAFNAATSNNMWKGGELTLDYDLTLEQLRQLGGTVYLSDVDYVVSLESIETPIYHPHSEKGRLQQVVLDSPLQHPDIQRETPLGLGYSIIMIDNQGKNGSRYINIGNTVYRIVPRRDFSKKDGIYIVSNNSMSSKMGGGAFESRYFELENAEERLGLYRTPDEAEYGGDKTIAAKEGLAKAQAELEQLKAERQKAEEKNGIAKAALEAQIREREVELTKEREAIAKERAEREHQENVRRKELADYYEQRSYERRDTSEGLKFLPSLLIGLGALFSVLKLSS